MDTFICFQLDGLLLKILVLINIEFIQLVITALVIIAAFYFLIGPKWQKYSVKGPYHIPIQHSLNIIFEE